MEISNYEDFRLRIHEALTLLNIPPRGRVSKVAGNTGYSQGAISEFLSGKKKINERFFQVFWRSFDINPDWLLTGEGVFSFKKTVDDIYFHPSTGVLEEDLIKALKSFPIREALFELGKMPDTKLWRAVTMLKEMNEKPDTK